MQVVHATFATGEGKEAVTLLENMGVEIEDYKLIESATGDLLIIHLLYHNVDALIDRLKHRFDFTNNVNRSLMIFTPDTVIPGNKEKLRNEQYRASRETIITYARQNSTVNSQLIFLAVVAATIASLGLILDNTSVIVGAMIIAPVFGPIAAMAIGIVLGDLKLLTKGIITELTVMVVGVSIGFLFGLIVPGVVITHAMEVRMSPTIPDLLVALAAGGAGAYALITQVKSQQLVGVVIAAALIPVMATIGIGLSMGNLQMVGGAALLVLGNLFTLLLAIIIVFYLKGLRPQWWYASTAKRLIRRSLAILTVSIVILAIPLSVTTYRHMIRTAPNELVRQIYEDYLNEEDAKLVEINVNEEEKNVSLVVHSYDYINTRYYQSLADRIKHEIGDDYQVVFEIVQTQRIETR